MIDNNEVMKKKICIVGAFDFVNKASGGQPVKTRELFYALNESDVYDIDTVETFGVKKHPLKFLNDLLFKVNKADIIIMLPAQNGIVFFSKIIKFFKHRKKRIFYDVIGGWLPEKLVGDALLKNRLYSVDSIWVETPSMKRDLEKIGFNNVCVIPNFKNITVVKKGDFVENYVEPYPLCTFSRVMREKGIEIAIDAVKSINGQHNRTVFTLDIYGDINSDYRERFNKIMAVCPDYIRYKGIVSPEKSTNVLKDYFALIFPTFYSGEGLPGTLIDALSSGVPSIVSDWHYNGDVIQDGYTGVVLEECTCECLKEQLEKIQKNSKWLSGMKQNCVAEAKNYSREVVLELIQKQLE